MNPPGPECAGKVRKLNRNKITLNKKIMSLSTFLRSKVIPSFVAAGAACVFLASPAVAAEYVSVKKDSVNVRTGPSTSNPVYMELFAGYPLKVVNRQGEWAKVTDYEGDTGWIHTSLIGKNNTVIINAKKSVNMRSAPSTQSAVVADVERGVVMSKVGEKGKWMQVKHSGGTVGWIYKPLLWP